MLECHKYSYCYVKSTLNVGLSHVVIVMPCKTCVNFHFGVLYV